MGNAAIVLDNFADDSTLAASSQALAMPASNLLTPHPSERWRSLTSPAYFVMDQGSVLAGDTVMICGLTAGANATAQLRLSSVDPTGAAGDIYDSGVVSAGSATFDVDYGAFIALLNAPASWRYVRFDLDDPDQTYVEAGLIFAGLRTVFDFNFSPAASAQYVDRSRIAVTAAGQTQVWPDNTFRRLDLPLEWVSAAQRFGVIEQLDRSTGMRKNLVLILDVASSFLARDCLLGTITDITPVTYVTTLADIFGKQLKFDERL